MGDAMVKFLNNMKKDTVYCANCLHCKKVPLRNESNTAYIFRVRCEKGQWNKDFYFYYTVLLRIIEPGDCDFYEPMGPLAVYKKSLNSDLPTSDIIFHNQYMKAVELDDYHLNGSQRRAHRRKRVFAEAMYKRTIKE
jgi:hypothetical protein